MSLKNFYRVSAIVIFVIAGLLIAFLVWRQKTEKLVLITQEQAFQSAIQACNPGYGLQPVEQPTEFQAELTTYEKALGFAPIPAKAEIPVWVITMKGKWLLVGGPPPEEDNSGPFYSDECIQIIDAQTGEWLSYPIE